MPTSSESQRNTLTIPLICPCKPSQNFASKASLKAHLNSDRHKAYENGKESVQSEMRDLHARHQEEINAMRREHTAETANCMIEINVWKDKALRLSAQYETGKQIDLLTGFDDVE